MTRRFLSEEAAARFSQDRIDAIRRLGALAAEHDAGFIVVAGDVFESNQLSSQIVARTIEALQSLPVPVFLLPGNHDPLDASSIFSSPEFAQLDESVIVIKDALPIPVPGVPHVEVVGAPWRTKHPDSDLCADMLAGLEPDPARIRVAVCHGQPDVLSPDKARPELINLTEAEAALADGRIHYLALGDRHSVTQVGSSGRIWFSGATVATDFTETEPNRALLVELSSDHCTVEPLDVGEWSFIAEHFELNGSEDLLRFAEWLSNLPNKARSVVKVGFTGTINLSTAGDMDALLSARSELFASLRKRQRTTELVIAPDVLDQDSVTLSGYAKAAWDELLGNAAADPVALDALRLYYRISQSERQS